jgi:predicted small secreted protein
MLKRFMTELSAAAFAAGLFSTLGGRNSVAGVGKDIEQGGPPSKRGRGEGALQEVADTGIGRFLGTADQTFSRPLRI